MNYNVDIILCHPCPRGLKVNKDVATLTLMLLLVAWEAGGGGGAIKAILAINGASADLGYMIRCTSISKLF